MESDSLIGYRKLLALLLALGATYAINKGLPPDIINSVSGILLHLIPTGAATLFMWFNERSKKIVAAPPGSATPPVPAAPAPGSATPPAPTAPAPGLEIPTTPKVPTMDATPPWAAEDDVLIAEQREIIAEWYNRIKTQPANMPVIPKREASLYMDVRERDQQRILEAQNQIAAQALVVFKGDEIVSCIKLRKSCDERIADRCWDHAKMARIRWQRYYLDQWLLQEGLPIY